MHISVEETSDTGPDPVGKLFSKLTIRIVPILCLCYFAAYIDRINVGFAKLRMLADLNLSEASYGFGAGLFFVGYIIFEAPSNYLLEKTSARTWLARIMISWGIVSAVGAAVQTPVQFYILRFLLGVGEAGFLPGVLYYLTGWFPSYRRGRIFSLFLIGLPLSGVVGGPLSGWIMVHFNRYLGLAGWRWLFLMEAIPSIVLGALILWLLPNTADKAPWLNKEERARLFEVMAADALNAGAHRSFREGLLDLKVWMLGGIDFAILLTTYALGFWLPTFIRNAGTVDPFLIGLYTAIPNIFALIAMIVISRSSDHFRERRWHIMIPFAIGALAIAAIPLIHLGAIGTLALYSIASAGVVGVVPVYFSLPATFLQGPAAAAGFALACSLANIAGLVSNSVIGLAMTFTGNANYALWIFAGFLCVGIALVKALPAEVVNR